MTGIRDYGDEGVVEYVVSELVRCLHGFGQESWEQLPREITGLKVGIVGLGKSGGMIADALKFFGADISYYALSLIHIFGRVRLLFSQSESFPISRK